MTTVTYDFTGTNGDPWSSTYWDFDAVAGSGGGPGSYPTSTTAVTQIQSNAGQISMGSWTDRHVVLKSGTGTFGHGDGEWLVTLAPEVWTSDDMYLMLNIRHTSSEMDTRYSLKIDLSTNGGSITKGRTSLWRYDRWGAGWVQIGSYWQIDVTSDPTAVYLKLYAVGSSIKAKSWSNNESEPGSWDVDVTDTNVANTREVCSFSFGNGGSVKYVRIDSMAWSDGASATNASAGNAAGTGTAYNPKASVAPKAGAATGTGTAYNATVTVSVNVGKAAGTGTAYNPTATTSGNTSANAGAATGTGAAQNPTVTVSVNAGVASGTGTAYNATVTTSAATSANAGVAAGTGTAYNATITVSVNAGQATGTGTAYGVATSVPDTIVGVIVTFRERPDAPAFTEPEPVVYREPPPIRGSE